MAVRENRGKGTALRLYPLGAAANCGLCPDSFFSLAPLIDGSRSAYVCVFSYKRHGHSWKAHFFPQNVFPLFLLVIPVVSLGDGDEVV